MDRNDKTKYKALCDTGASSTVIGEKLANYEPITVTNLPIYSQLLWEILLINSHQN